MAQEGLSSNWRSEGIIRFYNFMAFDWPGQGLIVSRTFSSVCDCQLCSLDFVGGGSR